MFITQTDSFKPINLSKGSDSFSPPLSLIWTGCSIARKHTRASASSDCSTEKRISTTLIHVLPALPPNLPDSCCTLGYILVPPRLYFLWHSFQDGFIKCISWVTCTPSGLETAAGTHRDQEITEEGLAVGQTSKHARSKHWEQKWGMGDGWATRKTVVLTLQSSGQSSKPLHSSFTLTNFHFFETLH